MVTDTARASEFPTTCPVCHQFQRTYGWLRWHLKHKHPDYEIEGNSLARAGKQVDYMRLWHLKYYTCDRCGVRHGPCLLDTSRHTCLMCGGNLVEMVKSTQEVANGETIRAL